MATIFCFTSTGNSLYAARRIADEIGAKVLPMREKYSQCDDDVIGFVFPDFFWGLPRIVTRFVRNLKIANKNAYVFAVVACGGPGFGVLGTLKALLAQNGTDLRYGVMLTSTSNYLPEFTANTSAELRKKVDARLAKIIADIKGKQSRGVFPATPLNAIVQKMFPGKTSDEHFTVAPSCTSCGTCQKVCPVKNIRLEDGTPIFQHNCEHCLACLHHCPACAIDWKGAKTRGKPRYRNAAVSLGDLIAFAGDE